MARKSKKVDFVNVKDQNRAIYTPLSEKSAAYQVALYARLSEETEANRERATIETQMELLRHFASEQDDMVVAKEYFDISYSGTNFERPGFEEMIQDMRMGKINCIIVKDLSRLGRNYVETGNYIERVFPFFDVRFIAVTDGYDSTKSGEELLMPIKNMINEMYVKDLVVKMKSAHRAIWKNGEFSTGKVPYGYKRIDRHLYVDENIRPTIIRLFNLFLAETSLKQITRIMTEEKCISPMSYKKMMLGKEIDEDRRFYWTSMTVRGILTNRVYTGDSVHNRVKWVNGKQVNNPESEWIIVENTHEAIISREIFEQVQKILQKNTKAFHSKHGKNGFDHQKYNLLGNRIICADCGKVLGFRTEGTTHRNKTFRCKSYLNTANRTCTMHKMDADTIYDAIFTTIHNHMKSCLDLEQVIKDLNTKSAQMKKYDIYGKEADKIRKELEKATSVKAGFFEDYKEGLLDEEQYTQMTERYADKISAYKVKLDELLAAQADYSKEFHIDENWKATVETYVSKRKLTREMVNAFVEKVVIFEDETYEIHLLYDDLLDRLTSIAKERKAA